MPRPRHRDEVLDVAVDRFYRDGIAATGVDALTAGAGVAKMTLYSNFGSKDDLVVAYLEERDRRFFARLVAEIATRAEPLDRALAVVACFEHYLDEEGFRGCAFVNAAAELPADHPGRAVVRRHKARVVDRWTDLIADLGVDEPRQVARGWSYLLGGAFAHAGVGLDDDRPATAHELIRARLDSVAGPGAATEVRGDDAS